MQTRCLWCAPKLPGYRQAKRQAGKRAGRQEEDQPGRGSPYCRRLKRLWPELDWASVDRAVPACGQRDKAGRSGT